MAEAKPTQCPKCGAESGIVSCPACGSVFYKDLAGWTTGLSAAVAVCLLVAVYAASWWLKAGAVAVVLICVGVLVWMRLALLRAARVRDPLGSTGGAPLSVRLWTATALAFAVAATGGGFVAYDRVESRPQPPAVAAKSPEPAAPPAPKPPLPVAVTFRPSATGTGQTVHLTGAPDIEPLVVEVTTYRTEKHDVPVVPVPGGGARARAALLLLLTAEEREKGAHVAVEARVRVQAGVEVPVVWGEKDFRLPPGQAVVLECPGYATLRTSTSVPFKDEEIIRLARAHLKATTPTPKVSPEYRPPVSAQRPPGLPRIDPEQQKRAREALARQLTTSFRDSAVGKGKVLVLTNAGPAAAPPLQVRVLRPSRIVRGTNEIVAEYTLASGVDAGRKAEVGWLELDKELLSGDWVELLLGGDVIKSIRVD